MGFTKESARKAQLKSAAARKKRNIAWELLGDSVMIKGGERLRNIIENGDDEQFLEAYKLILNFFKSKITKIDTESKVDVTINIPIKEWL